MGRALRRVRGRRPESTSDRATARPPRRPDADLDDPKLAALRRAAVGGCFAVANLVRRSDAPRLDAAPLERAWDAPRGSSEFREAAEAAAAAVLAEMRSFDARTARAMGRGDAALVEALAGVNRSVDDARYAARGGPDGPRRAAADAAARWVAAAAATAGHALLDEASTSENVLGDALASLGDDEDLLPRLLDWLGPPRCARLALAAAGDAPCPLRVAATAPWAPRVLTALLRAGADASAAPAPDGAPSLLRAALEAAPRSDARGRAASAARGHRVAHTALLTLLAADPAAALDADGDGCLVAVACAKGYLDLASSLLSAGAAVAAPRGAAAARTPLHVAAAAGDAALCARLVAALARDGGADAARGALLAAAGAAAPAADDAPRDPRSPPRTPSSNLLERLASAQTPSADTAAGGAEETGAYPIHAAVDAGAADVVELLLDALLDPARCGGDGGDDGAPALRPRHYRDAPLGAALLHHAAFARRPACLAKLVAARGFDVGARLAFRGRDATPLEVAVRRNCAESVTLLVRAGAEPDRGLALEAAAAGRGAAAVALLRSLLTARSADSLLDADAFLPSGETLLHAACRHGQVELARLLLSWGARANVRSKQGALPVHDCIASGHGAVTRVLATFCHEYDAAARALAWAFAANAMRKRRERQVGDTGAC